MGRTAKKMMWQFAKKILLMSAGFFYR